MQKSKKSSSREDDCVRESWEELEEDLDHMAVLPEPVEVKQNESLKKKGNFKPTDDHNCPQPSAHQTSGLESVTPEPGKVRILKRNPTPSVSNPATLPATSVTPSAKTYEERIKSYNEARLRILGSIDDEMQSQLQQESVDATHSDKSDTSSVR